MLYSSHLQTRSWSSYSRLYICVCILQQCFCYISGTTELFIARINKMFYWKSLAVADQTMIKVKVFYCKQKAIHGTLDWLRECWAIAGKWFSVLSHTLLVLRYSSKAIYLTHVDRAHTTYWLKACGFINLYWHVREEKPAKLMFKRQECRLRRH